MQCIALHCSTLMGPSEGREGVPGGAGLGQELQGPGQGGGGHLVQVSIGVYICVQLYCTVLLQCTLVQLCTIV